MVRSGQLAKVRHGAYTRDPSAERRIRHLQLILGTWPQLGSDVVVSHWSAAAFHGLPLFHDVTDRVWLTRRTGGHGRRIAMLNVRLCAVAEDEIVDDLGVRWTSLTRTAVDLARRLPLPRAVAVMDAVLRRGVTKEDLLENLARYPRRPGKHRAAGVVQFADPRSESVGESESRAVMHQRGLPAPTLQLEVREAGRLLGRADFGWEEERLIGEFDGRIKYGRLLKPEETATDVLLAEKEREHRLREAGWWVVRWGYDAVTHPQRLEQIIRTGFKQAAAFRSAA